MINLPSGKMKSREGKVVDADDIMDEMHGLAAAAVREKWPELSDSETGERAEALGLGALKYYLLAFNPQTTLTFDPEESLAFTGKTGVYAMYSYARTASILRKAGDVSLDTSCLVTLTSELEHALIRELSAFGGVVERAASELDPSKITEWIWRLAKAVATFFSAKDHNVLYTEDPRRRAERSTPSGVGAVGGHTLGASLSPTAPMSQPETAAR
jgi:arginyl-tRNA synthetase